MILQCSTCGVSEFLVELSVHYQVLFLHPCTRAWEWGYSYLHYIEVMNIKLTDVVLYAAGGEVLAQFPMSKCIQVSPSMY